MISLVLSNLEKVGAGVLLFLGSYLSNMCLGAWRSVKVEGYDFDWYMIANSAVKFVVLGVGIALLSIVVSILPAFITYVGIDVADETMQVLDSVVIVVAFVIASCKYAKDAYTKLKEILGN